MTRLQREPIHAIDTDGAAIVRVQLANSHLSARLLAEDFARIVELGFADQWVFNDNGYGQGYVRLAEWGASGSLLSVARLIAKASAGQIVRYADGDRTNLRRDNLRVRRGRAFGREKHAADAKASAARSTVSDATPCAHAAGVLA